jgi:hypothetical protein
VFAGLVFAVLAFVAGTSTPPIHVDSCSFIRSGSFENSVRIGFHNVSGRTATVVAFNVQNGPHHITVRDHGTFAPGATVVRVLSTPTWELYHAEPHACIVSFVTFSDGSTWGHSGR